MVKLLLDALFPLVFVMGLGWLSGKLGYMKRSEASTLASVVVRFALPLHLFIGALNTPPEKLQNFPFILALTIGLMGSYFISLLVAKYVFKHDIKTSAIQSLVCAFPDMAYFGAPVLSVLVGAVGFLGVLIGNLITSLLMIPITIILMRLGEDKRLESGDTGMGKILFDNLLKAIRNPIVWIPVLGAVLSVLGVKVPHVVESPVEMMGKTAAGISLFALGLMFYGERPTLTKNVSANVILKNLIQPAVMVTAGLVLKLEHVWMQELVVIGATPSAIAAGMFAIRNDTYVEDASSSILIGTALAIVTEGIMIALVS